MNIKLDSTVGKVKFNGSEVDKVKFNGAVVWSKPAAQHIYGVSWPNTTGNDTQLLTRTDDAANFADPIPYIADGSHPGSSPFDNCMPWKGIVKETINGDTYVKIPKFWYKYTFTSGHISQLLIADYPATDFSVSPAHMDKGYGEQDYAYIGRYLSSSSIDSKSGATPVKLTRTNARTNTRAKGNGYQLLDYSALVAIWMLYLVEFAHTDSLGKIGYGCRSGSGSTAYSTGVTDAMPYHTGTMATAITTYVNGTLYRYIEDLWGNIESWVDGIRCAYSSSQTQGYVGNTFSEYAELTGGLSIGAMPSASSGGQIRLLSTPSNGLVEWALKPYAAANATLNNVVPDYNSMYWSSSSSGKYNVYIGGATLKSTAAGLFYLANASNSITEGFRIQYIPQSA